MTRRRLLTSGGSALAGLALAVGALAPAQLVPVADEGVMHAGETRLVSARSEPTPSDPAVEAPAISDEGRYVAYQRGPIYEESDPYEQATYQIRLRDQTTGDEELISPAAGTSTAPSISGDGRLVAYSTPRGVYVVDRSDPANPVRHQVSGGGTDLRYQRTPDCIPRLEWDDLTEGGCGPVLSGDGTSLALPAELSVISPSLRPTIAGESGTYLDYGAHGLAVVDFQVREGEGDDLTLRREVVFSLAPDAAPVTFGQPTVSSDGSFDLFEAEGDCAGRTIGPGDVCVIGVEFTPSPPACASFGTSYGLLQVNSPTSAGQSAIALVGDQQITCGTARTVASAAAPGCPGTGDLPSEHSGSADPEDPHTVVNLREVDLGRTYDATQIVSNLDQELDQVVHFTASDCAMQLVTPEHTSTDLPPPCTENLTLEPSQECIAYVRYRPDSIGPSTATLSLSRSSFTLRRFRFVGAGRHAVVAMRRDQSGHGNFAGPGRPAAQVVSVDGDGQVMRGAAPSLSSDGRYVAFVSGFSWALYDPSVDPHRVYLHDTDRLGDRTYQLGSTTDVSVIDGPDGEANVSHVVQPSLSGDASRIAFVHVGDIEDGQQYVSSAQVHVRDLTAGVSHIVSTPTGSEVDGSFPADGISYRPSLSRDGSTVAFTSGASDLLPPDAEADGYAPQVYVRDLAPDFEGSGVPRTDIVSLRPDDDTAGQLAGTPAINAAGGVIAFASQSPLTELYHYSTQVYARIRYGGPAVEPTFLQFPAQEIGTTGPAQGITVSNTGPGPANVSVLVDGPFEVTNLCGDTAVHRGESCTVLVAFAPETPGIVNGVVTIVMTAFGWAGEEVRIEVSGPSIAQAFRLEPAAVEFPDQGIGTTSAPVVVRAVNISERVLDFSAGIEGGPGAVTARVEENVDDFTVAGPGGSEAVCTAVKPRGACRFLVFFAPTGLEPSLQQLVVVASFDGLELTQSAQLSGNTAEPVVELSPTVAREGRVIFVSGSNFLPGEPLELQWSGGRVVIPTVIPEEDGTFQAPVVVLPGRRAGSHLLTVTMPGIGSFDAPPVIVVPGSLQPPDFASRN